MARPVTSHGARLKGLQNALEKAKKVKRGAVLASQPMSDLLGVHWVTLRKWADELPGFAESGVFERGDKGINWSFKPVPTVRWLITYFENERKRSADKVRRQRRIIGGSDLDEVPEEYGLDEVAKMLRVSAELQQAKIRAGQLIDAAAAESAVRSMCSAMQQAVLRAAQEQDPAGQWPPAIRESFEDATRSILLRMEQAGTDCLRAFRGGAA